MKVQTHFTAGTLACHGAWLTLWTSTDEVETADEAATPFVGPALKDDKEKEKEGSIGVRQFQNVLSSTLATTLNVAMIAVFKQFFCA